MGNIFGQELECHKTTKLGVLGLVDHTHPTAAEFLDDAVVRDSLADHRKECWAIQIEIPSAVNMSQAYILRNDPERQCRAWQRNHVRGGEFYACAPNGYK
jgi:hypothetical protein